MPVSYREWLRDVRDVLISIIWLLFGVWGKGEGGPETYQVAPKERGI